MRKTVCLRHLIGGAILACTVLLILAIYPARIFRKEQVFSPRTQFAPLPAEAVNKERNLRQAFLPQYDRLSSLEVWVESLDAGRYMIATLYNEKEVAIAQRYIDLGTYELPGFVSIPLGVGCHVGERHVLLLENRFSTYRTGIVFTDSESAQVLQGLFYGWDPVPGMQLRMILHYDLPVSKKASLLFMGLAGILGAALFLAVRRFFAKHPEKDAILLPARVLGYGLTGASVVFYTALFVCNLPFRLFDLRPVECSFYALGIVIAALMTLGAIRRCFFEDAEALPLMKGETDDMPGAVSAGGEAPCGIREHLVSVLLALALQYTCNYVNGIVDAMHTDARRGMLVCLFAACVLLLIGTHPLKRLSALFRRMSVYAYLTALTGIVLLIFRNGRMWITWMVVLCAVLFFAAAPYASKGQWGTIFRNAAMLHFLLSMVYCLLFRAYQAYGYTRYGFVFSTATVTGEYMSAMCALCAVLVLSALERTRGEALIVRIKKAWIPLCLFGLTASYTLFTISRIGYVTAAAAVCVLVLVASCGRRMIVRAFCGACALLLAACAVFPAAFTMQRTLPALIGRHHVYEGPEETTTQPMILGRTDPGSSFYISIERFAVLFGERILGLPAPFYFYPYDEIENYYDDYSFRYVDSGFSPEKGHLYPPGMKVPVEEAAPAEEEAAPAHEEGASGEEVTAEEEAAPGGETSAEKAPAEGEPPAEEKEAPAEEEADVSNGRLDIWRSYIAELNMTGHPGMSGENTKGIHAHNIYLQTAFDCGIPAGVLFFAWIGITMCVGIFRYFRDGRKTQDLLALAAAASFALVGLGEWSFHLCNPVTLLFLCGIAPWMTRRERSGNE
ncbi:MAG: hypothetical protein IJQ12_06080 [Lachnospiraceae bacterium]|nr:hypothetical protein [Lachnospiraceae bacterium]